MAVGGIFQGVDPAVADAVAELLFLPPEDVGGEVWLRVGFVGGVEGFAEDVFLDAVFGDHFFGRVDGHCYVEELGLL